MKAIQPKGNWADPFVMGSCFRNEKEKACFFVNGACWLPFDQTIEQIFRVLNFIKMPDDSFYKTSLAADENLKNKA